MNYETVRFQSIWFSLISNVNRQRILPVLNGYYAVIGNTGAYRGSCHDLTDMQKISKSGICHFLDVALEEIEEIKRQSLTVHLIW